MLNYICNNSNQSKYNSRFDAQTYHGQRNTGKGHHINKRITQKVKLEYTDPKAIKFWAASITKNNLSLSCGKTGSKGQSRTSEFNTNVAAISKLDTAVKTKKLKADYFLADSLEEKESADIVLSDYDREVLEAIQCMAFDITCNQI